MGDSTPPERSADGQESASASEGLLLVVDDQDLVLRSLQRTLEYHGYDVLAATSGAMAIELFQNHGPKITAAIVDSNMPKMSGEATLAELHKLRSDLPAVLCSGYFDPDDLPDSGSDAIQLLQKPFVYAELRAAVDAAIAGAKQA